MTRNSQTSRPGWDARVIVRPWRLADVPAVFAAVDRSRAELGPWLAWCHGGYTVSDTHEYAQLQDDHWRRGIEYSLLIEGPGGEILGGSGLNYIDRLNARANLGYWTDSGWAAQGLATAVAARVAQWGLEELGFVRLEIVAAAENRASCRVAEKLGALREGLLRSRIRVAGRWQDANAYALLKEHLPALRGLGSSVTLNVPRPALTGTA